jgi:hypothetical protein
MNSSFFGSFGKRTFCDLYELNVRSVHQVLHIFEIIDKEVINHTIVTLPIDEDVEDGFVPSCFKKIKNSSYMLGILTDEEGKVLYDDNTVTLLDTHNGKDLNYCIERNKEFVHVILLDNIISIRVGKKQRVYIDEFNSISETPMSEYEAYKTESDLYINIMNYKKD